MSSVIVSMQNRRITWQKSYVQDLMKLGKALFNDEASDEAKLLFDAPVSASVKIHDIDPDFYKETPKVNDPGFEVKTPSINDG
ncbi:hypothetical protein vBKpnAMK4_00504 [Klebsiella phage vB_Kpn_AM_K4]